MQLKPESRMPLAPARGLSIVELMVGVAIGLFVVAGATLAVTGQLSENRRLLEDTRIQQDLRAAVAIISRDIRRAAYTGLAYRGVWPLDNAAGSLTNAYAAMTPVSGATGQVVYSASKALSPGQEDNVLTDDEVSGFRYNANAKSIEMQLGRGNWQALTDPASVVITRFDITVNDADLDVPCAQQCPVGPNGRALKLSTRNVQFTIVGQSATDPTVIRTLSNAVRVRNDIVWEVGP